MAKKTKNALKGAQKPKKKRFVDIPFERMGVRGGLRRHMLKRIQERDGRMSKSLAKSSQPVVKYYTELSKQGDIPSQLRLYTAPSEPLTEVSFVMASNIEDPKNREGKEYITPLALLPEPKKEKKYTIYDIDPSQRSWVWYPDISYWGNYYPAEEGEQLPFLKASRTNEWELPYRKLDFSSTVLAISGTHTIQMGVYQRLATEPQMPILEAIHLELSSLFGVIADPMKILDLQKNGYTLFEAYKALSADLKDPMGASPLAKGEKFYIWHKSYGKIASFSRSHEAFAAIGYKRKYVGKVGYAPAGKHLWVGRGEEVPEPIKFSVGIGEFTKSLALKYSMNSQRLYEILVYSLVYRVPSDLLQALTGNSEEYILTILKKAEAYMSLGAPIRRTGTSADFFPIDLMHVGL